MHETTGRYDAAYYRAFDIGGRASADVIAPLLVEHCRPSSVLDVGAGNGYWLDAFADLGIHDRQAIDGPFNDGIVVRQKGHRFKAVDLQQAGLDLGRRFDLALCLEVAEHLHADYGPRLVGELVEAAEVVAFSAAVPGQAGEGHVNLRPQSYWVAQFAERGYLPSDVVRPRVWDDPDVKWWYAQNTLVFARHPGADIDLLDVVHPQLVEQLRLDSARTVGGRTALRQLARAAASRGRRFARRSASESIEGTRRRPRPDPDYADSGS